MQVIETKLSAAAVLGGWEAARRTSGKRRLKQCISPGPGYAYAMMSDSSPLMAM